MIVSKLIKENSSDINVWLLGAPESIMAASKTRNLNFTSNLFWIIFFVCLIKCVFYFINNFISNFKIFFIYYLFIIHFFNHLFNTFKFFLHFLITHIKQYFLVLLEFIFIFLFLLLIYSLLKVFWNLNWFLLSPLKILNFIVLITIFYISLFLLRINNIFQILRLKLMVILFILNSI